MMLLLTTPIFGGRNGSLRTTLFLFKVLLVDASTVFTSAAILFTDSNSILGNLPHKNDVTLLSEPRVSISGFDPVLSVYMRTENATSSPFNEIVSLRTNNALKADANSERHDLTTPSTFRTVSFIATLTTKMTTSVLESGQGVVGATEYQQTLAITDKLRLALHLTALPLNSLNVVAYVQKSLRSPTATYQVAMSTSQILYILAVLVMPIAKLLYKGAESSYVGLVYSMAFGHYFIISVNRMMNGLVCLVSTERFLAIAFPMKAKLFRVSRRPSVPIAILCVSVFLSHVYLAIRYEFYELGEAINYTYPSFTCINTTSAATPSVPTVNVNDAARGDLISAPEKLLPPNSIDANSSTISLVYSAASQTVRGSDKMYSSPMPATVMTSLCPTSMNQSVPPAALVTSWSLRNSSAYLWNPYLMDTWGVVASCLWMYGAFVLMLLLNTLLAFSLWRHSRQCSNITTSDSAGKRDRQVRQTTLTVLASNFVFVLLSLLPVSNALANYLHPGYNTRTKYRYTYLLVHEIGQLSFSLRMCTDLLTFLLLSSGYRATLCQLIGRAFACLRGNDFHPNRDSGNKSKLNTNYTETGTHSSSLFPQETLHELKSCGNGS